MSKTKIPVLPKLEMLILAVFSISLLGIIVSKCGSGSQARPEEAIEEGTENSGSPAAQEAATIQKDTPRVVEKVRTIRERVTPLYITIDGMNMRSEPKLNSKILERLKLFDEVAFLNEVTDFSEEITIGEVTTNEPWIKVKSASGKVGWIYGAGLHYYRKKLPGVD